MPFEKQLLECPWALLEMMVVDHGYRIAHYYLGSVEPSKS